MRGAERRASFCPPALVPVTEARRDGNARGPARRADEVVQARLEAFELEPHATCRVNGDRGGRQVERGLEEFDRDIRGGKPSGLRAALEAIERDVEALV